MEPGPLRTLLFLRNPQTPKHQVQSFLFPSDESDPSSLRRKLGFLSNPIHRPRGFSPMGPFLDPFPRCSIHPLSCQDGPRGPSNYWGDLMGPERVDFLDCRHVQWSGIILMATTLLGTVCIMQVLYVPLRTPEMQDARPSLADRY